MTKEATMNDVFPELNRSPAAPASHKGRWIAGAVLATLAATGLTAWAGISQYNELQYNDVRVDYCWKLVLNQYTRRLELVPNLVAVVKSYAAHETALFNQIAATRASLVALTPSSTGGREPQRIEQFQAAQNQLSSQLSRLLIVAEKYPDLKSSSLYQDLMVQLEGTENRLAFARQQYFAGVADYNLGIRRFPGSLIAAQAGMKHRETIAIADESAVRRPIQVDLK
jgi:LemA protein